MRSKRIVYTTKKDHIKYFVQNWPIRSAFFYFQTVTWLCCHCDKSRLSRFMEYTIQGTPGSWNVLNHINTTLDGIHNLNIRKWKLYKTFEKLNILTLTSSPTFPNHLNTNEINKDIHRAYSKYSRQHLILTRKGTFSKNPPPLQSLF